jgi:hypothetical protein
MLPSGYEIRKHTEIADLYTSALDKKDQCKTVLDRHPR